MLTKETKTVEVHTYFFKGKGPFKSEQDALEGYLLDERGLRSNLH